MPKASPSSDIVKSRVLSTPIGHVTSWSFSKLGEFDKCRYRTWLLHVAKVPEPERSLPVGKSEHANDRGSRIHNDAELFVGGTGPATSELRRFDAEFEQMQALAKTGAVSLEGEWGFNADWTIAPWRTAWGRMKLDAIVFDGPHRAVVIDYKSGRRIGNEVKHGEQLQLYQLGAFMRFPELEEVVAELWYLDTDEITSMKFTRAQGLRFQRKFTERGTKLLENEDWSPNPSRYACQWCQYKKHLGGPCEVGV